MPFSTTQVDTYRGTSGVSLPTELSNDIWAQAQEDSAVMRLATRITLPGRGLSIPVITGDATADWVIESAEKPVSEATLDTKVMTPYKLAIIELFSNEFARDARALYDALRDRMPGAIAKKFDATVFHGSAPGTGFDVLSAATPISLDAANKGEWAALVQAYNDIAIAGGSLDGWALSPQGKGILLGATDGDGRPLFINNTADGAVPMILGQRVADSRAAYKSGTPDIVGIAGDWTKARYGIVEDIQIKISEDATINDGTNQINLWQRNMFAVMCEIEVGFVVEDDDYFALLTK